MKHSIAVLLASALFIVTTAATANGLEDDLIYGNRALTHSDLMESRAMAPVPFNVSEINNMDNMTDMIYGNC